MNKIKFGLLGLIFILIAPLLDYVRFAITESKINERTELYNQAFKEQFGEGSVRLDDPKLRQFQQAQEPQPPTVFEAILSRFLYLMIYYISPGGGILLGILSILKDKRFGKFLGILSVLGGLYVIYTHLLEAAFYRMI